MAKIFPPRPPEGCPKSELKVRNALGQAENLTLLHSVVWQSRRKGIQSDGEADFIILHPRHGIAIIEVKGGGIEIVDGKWYSTDAQNVRHPIKNPFEQAKDSKYALVSYLKAIHKNLSQIPVVHGVIFPDITVDAHFGMSGPREITIDKNDLSKPGNALSRLFAYWEKNHVIAQSDVDKLISCLAPTTTIRRRLADEVADAERALIKLTQEQARILQALKRIPHAAILGGAGTGKTVIAMEKARQLAQSGFRTLLLCYNEPLKRHLELEMNGSGVDVHTYHSLVASEARRAKIKLPIDPPVDWYEKEAPELLLTASSHNATTYDALLVDEGQDFSSTWLDSLQVLLADMSALFYLFADSHQDLYRRDWKLPTGFVEFELTVNCRNTRPIAQKVARIFSDSIEGLSIDGPAPVFLEVDRPDQIVPYTARLLEELLQQENLQPSQIIVLTDTSAIVTSLRTMIVAGHLFTKLDGHGIPVETVYRFKGLERHVVVLALTDKAATADLKALAYVGLSRARAGLYVIGSKTIRSAILWDS